MEDRELLEMAAKAAGIEIEPCTCSDPKWPFRLKSGSGFSHWNPLIHDGDALRLAVKLGADIQPKGVGVEVWIFGRRVSSGVVEYGADPYAATRRAIVSAAAEIGKEMK